MNIARTLLAIAYVTLVSWTVQQQPVCAQSLELQSGWQPSLAGHIQSLNRKSKWELVSQHQLAFDTFHPQGLTMANGRYYLSTVENRAGNPQFDANLTPGRSANVGRGHLICFSAAGDKLRAIDLGEGAIYHPGGIDRDDESIWVPVAQYRPDSSSIIYRVSMNDFSVTEVFRFPDHIGAIVRDSERNRLIGFSWGGRRIYSWSLNEDLELVEPETGSTHAHTMTSQHYIDYQDCQYLGNGLALCSGLASYSIPGGQRFALGGLELFDLQTFRPIFQIPIELYTSGTPARVMTQNPCFAETVRDKLRLHFIPEDNHSLHYIYELRSE